MTSERQLKPKNGWRIACGERKGTNVERGNARATKPRAASNKLKQVRGKGSGQRRLVAAEAQRPPGNGKTRMPTGEHKDER